MDCWRPDRILVGEDELAGVVADLAGRISRAYRSSVTPDNPLLLVCVLKGAVVFLSDLMRKLDIPVAVDFMAVSSYGSSTYSSGVVRILKDLDTSIEGRHVLVVEDIVDTGLTLDYLRAILVARNPASLRVCALLDKPDRRQVGVDVEFVGLGIPDEFAVGYGLDYDGRYRQLPYVAVLEEPMPEGEEGSHGRASK